MLSRSQRKQREYYMAILRTIAPYIQVSLTLYLIWRIK